ncbi:MAG: LTA synthase family protein [Desulfoarculaceae bacterium]|nr:LTA synthase family protein [Desulfoarculaceae bacterium]
MSKTSRTLTLFLPAISTSLAYGLAYLVSTHFFSVTISTLGMTRDFPLLLAVSYLLFFLSRNIWTFIGLQWLIIGILYIGNAVKLSFFGGPMVPDDVYALRSLLLILSGWQRFLVVGALTGLAGLLLFNFQFRRGRAWLSLGLILALGLILIHYPQPIVAALDKRVGNSVWDQRSNYLGKGATLYSLQETARFFRDMEQTPDRKKATGAASALLTRSSAHTVSPAQGPRNVYVILLESFWDPLLLKDIQFNQDPLPPSFRELWQATGNSTIMSPVFGGYTANAEFESLCGFPVVHDDVKFERRLINTAPCLPAILEEHDYNTVVSHPNIPAFWNRTNAYRRLGFKTYWSIKDFNLDDMNYKFLSDASLYRQVMEKSAQLEEPKKPVFNYIITYSGHWDGSRIYPRNEESRPQVINCVGECKTPEIESYANTVHYKAKELMEFVDELKKNDPDALIVAFGDHLPFLGGNFQGYVEAGTLAGTRNQFTPEMFLTYVSTPLIVIDGKRGPVDLGSLPLYQLPGRILELLGIGEPTIMSYAGSKQGAGVRPLWGVHFINTAPGKVEICKDSEQSPTCEASTAWLDQLLTVGIDVFQGEQFSLPMPERPTQLAAARTDAAVQKATEQVVR